MNELNKIKAINKLSKNFCKKCDNFCPYLTLGEKSEDIFEGCLHRKACESLLEKL